MQRTRIFVEEREEMAIEIAKEFINNGVGWRLYHNATGLTLGQIQRLKINKVKNHSGKIF